VIVSGDDDTSVRPYSLRDLFLRADVRDPDWGLAHALRYMGFYNFQPDAMRRLQHPSPQWLLEGDGSNIASVISSTQDLDPSAIDPVKRYLAVITEPVELQGPIRYGEYETLRFVVRRPGLDRGIDFDAVSMSDGTLRTLGALVAAFQVVGQYGYPRLVAIEELETSLHPAAMRALVDALDEATLRTQILLTTHSAEMLDNPTIRPESIRVVQMIDGQTVIAPVDKASVEIVARNLNTLGGLEREDQLGPDLDDRDRQRCLAEERREGPPRDVLHRPDRGRAYGGPLRGTAAPARLGGAARGPG
jgi:hypothetical protein